MKDNDDQFLCRLLLAPVPFVFILLMTHFSLALRNVGALCVEMSMRLLRLIDQSSARVQRVRLVGFFLLSSKRPSGNRVERFFIHKSSIIRKTSRSAFHLREISWWIRLRNSFGATGIWWQDSILWLQMKLCKNRAVKSCARNAMRCVLEAAKRENWHPFDTGGMGWDFRSVELWSASVRLLHFNIENFS